MGRPSKIQNSFSGGEISPELFGRTDLAKWNNGCSTLRNMFVSYRGGASSRAGLKYVGTCLQDGNGPPPRDIDFQFNINQGYALEFGDQVVTRTVTNAADAGGLIRITLDSTRGLMTGMATVISGVVGTTEANGAWIITVIDGTDIDLQDSVFANAYVSGGISVTPNAGYMRIKSNGAYVVEDAQDITNITQGNPGVFTYDNSDYTLQNGDWIFVTGVGGMTDFNGLVWIVYDVTGTDFSVTDLFGVPVETLSFSAYTSGGSLERIFTSPAPYAAVDLPYLKFTQSADTMSLCCVNQQTGTEYPPYDLVRNGATDWDFTEVTFESSIDAPTGLAITVHASTTLSTYYSYVVTAVNENGEESVASAPDQDQNNDISVNAGSNSLTWNVVTGATSYNIYRATPQYGAMVPSGVLYGYLGTSTGNNFVDTNIIADFTKVPPTHNDPFDGDNNQPSCVAYFQQRRVYANTQSQPDTYFFSRPGAFTNMDISIPITDDAAIIGAPWAQQVNGIQFMQPMTNGLIILTGNGAWLLNGGGENNAITPSSQTAQSQAYNGCSDHIPPLVVNYDVLYVQSKGSIVRDLAYNFFTNVFTGTDMTVLSSHLFNYHQMQQWAYCEEPYKLIWLARDDGIMLCLTYLKEQDVYAWSRHDTNGFFVGVCSVTEPPVDVLYTIVKRYINGQWKYYSERMDNRNWTNAENCFCVDAGLSTPLTFPDATLIPASAEGTSNISSVLLINGGSGYTAPTVMAVGAGSGATFSVTLSSGEITAINVLTEGSGYVEGDTTLVITDTTGSGADAHPTITNYVTFTTDANVFTVDNEGDVIRLGNPDAPIEVGAGVTLTGGGKAVIVEYVSATEVVANIVEPITAVMYDNGVDMPVPAISGQWSLSTPVTTISGLNHLEGMEVSILADGGVEAPQTVVDGSITLQNEASLVTIGLPYICQLQSLYLETPSQDTLQGKRKDISSVVVRTENSRGFTVGTDEPDQSTQPNNATVPWTDMVEVKERNALANAGNAIPLFTGDSFVNVGGSWSEYAQTAVQTVNPLPLNILALIISFRAGDT
jgi:hypothetical protein